MKLSMGYPNYQEEKEMMNRFIEKDPLDSLESVVTLNDLEYVQNNFNKVYISEDIKEYIVNLVTATRTHKEIELGCSPRATLNLMKGCQALAAIRERDYVITEDVKELAIPIMSHRIILKNEINSGTDSGEQIIKEILNTINTPIEKP